MARFSAEETTCADYQSMEEETEHVVQDERSVEENKWGGYNGKEKKGRWGPDSEELTTIYPTGKLSPYN